MACLTASLAGEAECPRQATAPAYSFGPPEDDAAGGVSGKNTPLLPVLALVGSILVGRPSRTPAQRQGHRPPGEALRGRLVSGDASSVSPSCPATKAGSRGRTN